MRNRRLFDTVGLSTIPRRRHAMVVGGSLAGMLAARVLSGHFDDVTLLERDEFPETPTGRKGLPQGRHAHGLLERGRGVMERLLPGLTDELVQAGAELMDGIRDIATLCPYGWYVRCPGDLLMLASSRDLIDWGVRGRVAAIPNVRIRQGVDVAGLIRGPGVGAGVAGVRLRPRPAREGADRGSTELAADLVVVADGRNSRLPDWLIALGYEPPPEAVANSFQGYASLRYRPAAGFKADWKEKGGVPHDPSAVGAVRPRRSGPPGVRPARGRERRGPPEARISPGGHHRRSPASPTAGCGP